jgi:hypothetical protein
MRLIHAAVLFVALAAPAQAEEAERALVVTVKWDDQGAVSIEGVEKKQLPVPSQQGFPQLYARFFELRSQDGDVYFSGPLHDNRRSYAGGGERPPFATYTVVVPDLDEARHLVIVERVSDDPDTGRKIVAEKDL